MEYAKGRVKSEVTTEHNNSQERTRAEHRQQEEAIAKEKPGKTRRLVRLRLIPIWLRLLIVAALILLSATAGVIVGYGVIGDGEPTDALKTSTWQHIIDLVEKK
ncbi:DNA-directed RNA polymerase subunit beta [Litchfieldia salsa]|uniref:DNA-directed RNA polymerase subunit beta n=1 Tax=Litchfieldia salsa TaxID=930152 RepID=A0A1H0U1P8_9BACI|nr:DNA-directed RNA polymerase subunit beta [Litchfieldia salsa]SDP60113.1 DNA-directed RNA polymerase subunit beta [Litchfieldia salsa]